VTNVTPDRSIRAALTSTREHLQAAGLEEPGIEAELLMRQALRQDEVELPSRASLFQRFEEPVNRSVSDRLDALLQRRLAGEPSAYITGEREFWGLKFAVTPDVLIPRPETELLVQTAIEQAIGQSVNQRDVRTGPLLLVDVGTGSGAIAVALARDVPIATIYATDASSRALSIARANAERCGVERRIQFFRGDLLLPLPRQVALIVANLPYVATKDWHCLATEVREHEPRLAFDGGDDGLELVRNLLHQAPHYLMPGGAICLEIGAGQSKAVGALVATAMPGASKRIVEDFAAIPRVVIIQTR
jgi:release factor glutamine methyltransferase